MRGFFSGVGFIPDAGSRRPPAGVAAAAAAALAGTSANAETGHGVSQAAQTVLLSAFIKVHRIPQPCPSLLVGELRIPRDLHRTEPVLRSVVEKGGLTVFQVACRL